MLVSGNFIAMTAPFPPARGSRASWETLGRDVRVALEREFGAPIVGASTQAEGFSPAVAAVVVFDNGAKAFVKAVNRQANPDSPGIYRTEARIAGQLPPAPWAPRLLWCYDDSDWVALAFEYIEGRTPTLPWQRAQLDRGPHGVGRTRSGRHPDDRGCWRVGYKARRGVQRMEEDGRQW